MLGHFSDNNLKPILSEEVSQKQVKWRRTSHHIEIGKQSQKYGLHFQTKQIKNFSGAF